MRAVVTIWNKVRSRLGTGGTVSTVAHVLILGSTLVWFSAAPLKVSEEDSIPIDIISDTQLSKLTAGIKTAPKAETPKPMADKVGEAKQPQDQAAKVVDNKPEVRTASKEATPPPEPPKPKAAEAKKPEPKTDEIAEALKKAEKKPAPPKPQPQPKKPDPNLEAKIESKLALLDKRESQRQTITNTMVSPASLGTTTPNSQFLMQSWMGALRARVESFWDIPAGSLDVAIWSSRSESGSIATARSRASRLCSTTARTRHSELPRKRRCARFAVARPIASFPPHNTRRGTTSSSISGRKTCFAAPPHLRRNSEDLC